MVHGYIYCVHSSFIYTMPTRLVLTSETREVFRYLFVGTFGYIAIRKYHKPTKKHIYIQINMNHHSLLKRWSHARIRYTFKCTHIALHIRYTCRIITEKHSLPYISEQHSKTIETDHVDGFFVLRFPPRTITVAFRSHRIRNFYILIRLQHFKWAYSLWPFYAQQISFANAQRIRPSILFMPCRKDIGTAHRGPYVRME